jgi:hypothetical protein
MSTHRDFRDLDVGSTDGGCANWSRGHDFFYLEESELMQDQPRYLTAFIPMLPTSSTWSLQQVGRSYRFAPYMSDGGCGFNTDKGGYEMVYLGITGCVSVAEKFHVI